MKAEQFILKYEQNRLIGHKNYEKIEIISIDVSAGYDIISFKSKDSVNTDKLIEAKLTKEKGLFGQNGYLQRRKIPITIFYI